MKGEGGAGREGETRTLADGRTLGFAECDDPAGDPVFYFHGWPGSRIEARLVAPAASALGARVIAVDRPGCGLSSDLPKRTLGSWSNDVSELADALGLGRFAVLGVSGGGPYALSCAARLGDRVQRASIVCGVGPLGHAPITAGMARARRIACAVLREAPSTSWPLCYLVTRQLRRNATAALAILASTLPGPDRAALRRPAVLETLAASFAEALSTSIRGASRDLRLYFHTWDFDLRAVTARVSLWHGERDTIVPAASSRHVAELLPAARLRLVPEAGHYSLPIDGAGTILSDLLERPGQML